MYKRKKLENMLRHNLKNPRDLKVLNRLNNYWKMCSQLHLSQDLTSKAPLLYLPDWLCCNFLVW